MVVFSSSANKDFKYQFILLGEVEARLLLLLLSLTGDREQPLICKGGLCKEGAKTFGFAQGKYRIVKL